MTLSPSAADTAAPRVGLVSLGCAKALVDSERIVTRLRAEGYAFAESYEGADVVVVNTCGFLDSARQESLAAIAEALAENGRVIVTGCLGAVGTLVQDVHPAVLAVTGPHQTEAVLEAVHQAAPPPRAPFLEVVPPGGLRLTPDHYAYLKISEGCDHKCSFCIIPQLRGPLVSRPAAEILAEAEAMVADGVRELLVVSQDTGAYGRDLGHATSPWQGRPVVAALPDLAAALGDLGVWVRLHYVYPYPQVDRVLPLMAEGRVLPYLDVPFQHASPSVLRAMRRPGAMERTLERVQAWRAAVPDLTLRSTFIVGFPGETEEDFETLLSWLEAAALDRVGCFRYEDVPGADSNALGDTVDEEEKEDRWQRLMEVQAGISADRLQRRVGETLAVMIDGPDEEGEGLVGRTAGDSPDVDGVVHLPAADLPPGTVVPVRITEADAYDLTGIFVTA